MIRGHTIPNLALVSPKYSPRVRFIRFMATFFQNPLEDATHATSQSPPTFLEAPIFESGITWRVLVANEGMDLWKLPHFVEYMVGATIGIFSSSPY